MILVTAFNCFGGLEVNPSELIVNSIASRPQGSRSDLVTEVLPTEYRRGGGRISELIRHFKPEAILCLGVAMGTPTIRIERVALNLDDCEMADNAGEVALGRHIEPEGPVGYRSTLPLTGLVRALESRQIPVVISNHAGTFLCNHVFYVARHQVEELGIPCQCGFLHVPPLSASLPLPLMVEGIEACISLLRGGKRA